jgi:hypothetical protein
MDTVGVQQQQHTTALAIGVVCQLLLTDMCAVCSVVGQLQLCPNALPSWCCACHAHMPFRHTLQILVHRIPGLWWVSRRSSLPCDLHMHTSAAVSAGRCTATLFQALCGPAHCTLYRVRSIVYAKA